MSEQPPSTYYKHKSRQGKTFKWEHDESGCHASIVRKLKEMNTSAQLTVSLPFIPAYGVVLPKFKVGIPSSDEPS